MKEIKSYIKIAKLISSSIIGRMNKDDLQYLNNWKTESQKNKEIADNLTKLHKFEDWAEIYYSFDPKDSWTKIEPKLSHKVFIRRLSIQVGKIAAALLIPISLFLVYNNYHVKKHSNQFSNVSPGYPRAYLSLNNGQIIDLEDKDTTFQIGHINVSINDNLIAYNATNRKITELGYNILTTPRGGEYSLILSDGTKIKLNAMTNLRYPIAFLDKKRDVRLNGEAFFEVYPTTNQPFKVEVDKIGIEVLGTIFNIKAYQKEDGVQTTLNEGKVKVFSTNKEIILKPNQQATFSKTFNRMIIEDVDASIYSAWTQEKFVFKDIRLEEIMQSLTKWYNFKIIYESQDLKDIRFSINVNRYDDINYIFEFLAATQTIKYEIKNNVATIRKTN